MFNIFMWKEADNPELQRSGISIQTTVIGLINSIAELSGNKPSGLGYAHRERLLNALSDVVIGYNFLKLSKDFDELDKIWRVRRGAFKVGQIARFDKKYADAWNGYLRRKFRMCINEATKLRLLPRENKEIYID